MSEMRSELLVVKGVVKRFGGFTALDGVDLDLKVGERLGLIGPNGSGKSTLVNCICGTLFNDQGSVAFEGEEISRLAAHKRIRRGLARSFQLPKPFATMTVVENLCVPILYAANARPGVVRASPAQAVEQAMEILNKIGLGAKAREMSGGLTQVDMRKLELARAMASRPKLLISDEAMAGLSNSEVDEILELLFAMKEQGIAVIMIEHIMRAVMRFSERVAVLVAGKKIADGDPEEVMRNPEVERAYLGE
ncbi:MAG: branched-chain amino acid transporter ATP-binding protein [Betaproteobacteria bacterium]|nr:branched-chain amino acid transporter ATP-binding protein [Betaproteobacteria bacterium]